MSDTVQCGYCGKPVSTTEYELLENGSPAHPECVKEEQKQKENR